jgi:hypothetical protein
MTTQNSELRESLDALLEEFVLYRDDMPHSNEPTELSVFLRQCDFPGAMGRLGDELQEFINSEALALLERLEKQNETRWSKTETYTTDLCVPLSAIEAERRRYE